MKKMIMTLALVTFGSVANANSVYMSSIKCSEYNHLLEMQTDYVIHTDIGEKSEKGIIVSTIDSLSIAYNVNIKTKGELYLEAITDSELMTEVISVNLGDKVSGVRTVTLKNSNDTPLKYSLTCEVIDILD